MIKFKLYKKISIHILTACCLLLFLSACTRNNTDNAERNVVRVIHSNSFSDDNGLVYDDFKVGLFKCYFDFETMKNIYFCTKPNCDHTALDCNSRLCHPYTFFIGNDQYYIEKKYEMHDSTETFISYLFKSDVSNTETKIVAALDCDMINDIYLINNTLYIVAPKPKFVDGISTSAERWDLYQIDMTNYKVKRITLNSNEGIDGYIPSGVIGNNLIIYHRYYDKIINPEDYGLKGNLEDYLKDEKNYKRYMAAVMDVFHEEMFSLNLDTGEQTSLDLPTPLLVYRDCYYYNRKRADGSYEMVSYNFNSKEEKIIYEGPVKTCNAIGDNIFFTEGIEKISDTTFELIIGFKEDAREFCYNLLTGELKEVNSRLPNKVEMKLVKEYGDYYIFLYSDRNSNVGQRVGYILKDDYFNDKSKFTLVAPE